MISLGMCVSFPLLSTPILPQVRGGGEGGARAAQYVLEACGTCSLPCCMAVEIPSRPGWASAPCEMTSCLFWKSVCRQKASGRACNSADWLLCYYPETEAWAEQHEQLIECVTRVCLYAGEWGLGKEKEAQWKPLKTSSGQSLEEWVFLVCVENFL